ncbi:MAG: radical SAM protein [Candidatus Omnitrophica bacterium]|nr:radical SAM protein [Candidatus Omnitrophota bacterium]
MGKENLKLRKRNEIIGKYPLTGLYVNPTRFCNLACRHCWLSPPQTDSLTAGSEELGAEEIIRLAEAALPLGLNNIKLTGGEPLLKNDIPELLKYCCKKKISVDIETNGTLITDEMAKVFKKLSVRQISVSLDSADPELHDFFRNKKGAFDDTIRGIKALTKNSYSPQVIMSLYRENLKDFGDFLAFMKKLRISDIKINVISLVGRGKKLKEKGGIPSIEEILEFSKKIDRFSEDFKGSIFLDIPAAFKKLRVMEREGCKVCAILNILGILSDGSVSFCGIGFMEEKLIFGNIRDKDFSLGNIWTGDPVLKKLRRDVPNNLGGVCAKCIFKKRCLGSCRAEVYHNSGNLTDAHWFCQEAYDKGYFPTTRIVPCKETV